MTGAQKAAIRPLALKFLLGWFLSVVALAAVGLALNADWCRPHFESALSNLFHRNVRLGHISWSFGLNGLAIATNKIQLDEMDGAPFLKAGRTEIGVAFRPLFKGDVELHHLDFEKPELWATREENGKWNFTDLIKFGPDVRIIQIVDGRLHLTDMAAPKAYRSSLNLDDLQVKFVWPKKKLSKPFFLSFKLAQPKYTTSFQMSGLGVGAIEDWQRNHYTINVSAKQINPDDGLRLAAFLMKPDDSVKLQPRQLSGLFDVSVKGEGTLDKGIKLEATMEADKLVLKDSKMGSLHAANANSKGHLTVDKQKIAWDDFTLNLPGVNLKSNGELRKWRGSKSEYSSNLTGRVEDLRSLNTLLKAPPSTNGKKNAAFALLDSISPDRLTGRAEIVLNIVGGNKSALIESNFKAGGLLLKDLLEEAAPPNARFAVLAAVPERSSVKGDVKLAAGEKLEVRSAEADIAGGIVKINGETDLKTRHSKYELRASNLDLAAISTNMNNSAEARRELAARIEVPAKSRLQLSGHADMVTRLERRGTVTTQDTHLTLRRANFKISDGSLNISDMNGKLTVTDNSFHFDNITGIMDGGQFALSGHVPFHGGGINLTASGKKIDVDKLTRALIAFKMEIPQMAGVKATGRVKEAHLKIIGSLVKPVITGTAIPEEVRLEILSAKRFIKATGGSLALNGDLLTLKDMTLATKGGSALVTARLSGVPGEAQLVDGRIKSQSLDLADFDAWINSSVVPEKLRKDYNLMLKTYSISKVHGKIYGDILLKGNPTETLPRFDGVIGLMGVGFNVDKEQVSVNRLSGVLATAGDELLLQDIAGWINNSQFEADGDIKQFRTKEPFLSSEIRGTLNAKEINQLISAFSPAKKASQLRFTCQGPLDVKVKFAGTQENLKVQFAGRAISKNTVKLHGPFGTLHQPAGENMSMDGSVTIHDKGVTIEGAHLFVSDSVLNFKGEIKVKGDDGKPLMDDQVLNLVVLTPNALPARRMLAAVAPAIAEDDVTGTIKVDGALSGAMSNPKIKGIFDLTKVSVPKMKFMNATGRMESRDPYDPRSQAAPINAKVDMKELEVSGIKVTDVTGDMSFRPSGGEDKLPKVRLANMKLKAGGGNVSLNCWIDPETQKMGTRAEFKGVDLDAISTGLFGHSGEIVGHATGDLQLKSQGRNKEEMIKNLSGNGSFDVKNGILARFGRLQARLTQANLLQSGLLGFNLNNLLQSVVPVRTGTFKELTGKYQIANGVLAFNDLRFNGEDMRLWGGGTANLIDGKVSMEIAGTLPRVTASVLGGPLGHMSRGLTVQRLLSTVTFNKLEKLPSLPILGDIAADKPRTFTFKMNAPLNEPKVLAQSIEKSFKWLPSKPLASAHPVPGIDSKVLEAKAN